MGIQLTESQSKHKKKQTSGLGVQYSSPKTLFFSFIKRSPILVTLAMIISIVSALITSLPSIVIGIALDELNEAGFSENFIFLVLSIILLAILYLVISFISNYAFLRVAFAFEKDLRQEFFDSIQNHSLTFHDENNSGKLLSMGMTETAQVRMAINPSLRMLVTSFFTMGVVTFYFLQVQSTYSLFIVSGFILYLVLAYLYSRKIGPIRNALADSIGEVTEASQEIFRGIEVVRGFSAEEREKNRFNNKSEEYADLTVKEQRLQAFYWPGLLLLGMTAAIFGIGILDVFNGVITIGNLVSAVTLLFSLNRLNFVIPMSLLNLQAGLTNSKRIFDKLCWKDPQPDVAHEEIEDINWKSDIIFDQVSFSYTNGSTTKTDTKQKMAIQDLDVTIPFGSQIAIIGGPGSGKSTILKLLLRLYDPQQGRVLIDGYDYADIPAKQIRRHVSRVEQEIFLFSGTIKENIAFANPTASDEEIKIAAKAAQAHEFIKEMPKGYNSIIGERGVTLSGGQKQRVAIARAILANSEILLLDDSASAIDSKTELLLRRALDNLRSGRTTITITQRLNTLVRADKIILMDKGQADAIGTHEELLGTSEKYQKIFELLPEAEQVSKEDLEKELNQGGVST